MNLIGGELPLKKENYAVYFTDSGRSSLRLLLQSEISNGLKFVLPDFFCGIIEDIFKQEGKEYDFYKINSDLTIDFTDLSNKKYDVLYVINYFGLVNDLSSIKDLLSEKIVIEDNVYFSDFKNNWEFKKWFAFNSFRKISNLSDGSLIKTNLEIEHKLIQSEEAEFPIIKQKAKDIKYRYIENKEKDEETYLNLFKKAEDLINLQTSIFKMSDISIYQLLNLNKNTDQEVIKNRYFQMKHLVKDEFETNPTYFSYYFFIHTRKSEIYSNFKQIGVFLPNFWPKTSKENLLYDNLVTIPLFSYYSDNQFEIIKNEILKYL